MTALAKLHQGSTAPLGPRLVLSRRRLMAELYDLKDGYNDRASSRCQRCDHYTAGNAVKVMHNRGALPHYQGLQRCGLLWECPTCSARIKARRAHEVLAV